MDSYKACQKPMPLTSLGKPGFALGAEAFTNVRLRLKWETSETHLANLRTLNCEEIKYRCAKA